MVYKWLRTPRFGLPGFRGRALGKITSLVYPCTCVICSGPGVYGLDLCLGCRRELPWNRLGCPRCALPLPRHSMHGTPCASCQQRPPPYDGAWSALRYTGALRWLHRRFKFGAGLAHSRLLGTLLADALEEAMDTGKLARPDRLVVMPLHPWRLARRGFNQSLELVRPSVKRLHFEVDVDVLLRTRATRPQTDLPAGLRQRNVRGAFECRQDLTGVRVVLFDDVVTTGHTVAEAARVLRLAGAEEINVWSLARTP